MRFLLYVLALLLALAGCTQNQVGKLEATAFGNLPDRPPVRQPYDEDLNAACGPGGLTELGGRRLLRAPYVQSVTAREASVLWTADTEDLGAIELRSASAPRSEAAAIPPEHDASMKLPAGDQFRARATDLKADTTYCYRLVGPGGAWTDWTGFRTAPPAASDETVRFAALGDTGAGTIDQHAVLEAMQEFSIELVVMTGDIAYESGTLEQFEDRFFAVYREMLDNVPFFPVAGNHDYETRGGEPFRAVFALPENGGPEGRERWYSTDWGSVHFVALDTARVGPEQAAWLEEDLAENDSRWTVVYAHRPPYSSGKHGSRMDVRRTFSPIFERHGVDLVLLGHDHHYERTEPIGGVTYIVTGGGGRGTRPVKSSDFTAFSHSVAHFVYVVAEPDRLTTYAIDATGKVFDSTELRSVSEHAGEARDRNVR